MTLVEKLETKRRKGNIEDHFKIAGKEYVFQRLDPQSNNHDEGTYKKHDTERPVEAILVNLVYGILYG